MSHPELIWNIIINIIRIEDKNQIILFMSLNRYGGYHCLTVLCTFAAQKLNPSFNLELRINKKLSS